MSVWECFRKPETHNTISDSPCLHIAFIWFSLRLSHSQVNMYLSDALTVSSALGELYCMWMCVFNCLHLYLFLFAEPPQRVSVYSQDHEASCLSPRWSVSTCSCRFNPVTAFMCSSDRAASPGGPVVQRWASSWTTGRWMSCEVLLSVQTTTYSLHRGSLCDCHQHYCVPSDAKPLSPDSSLLLHSCFFFLFGNILIQTERQI